MKLDEIPVELLAQILSQDLSGAAVHLWCCGSRLLQYKLSRGAVIDLFICLSPYAPAWPTCLPNFTKLRSLNVNGAALLESSTEKLRLAIESLPPGIKSLKVHQEGTIPALFDLPQNDAPPSRQSPSKKPSSASSNTTSPSTSHSSAHSPWFKVLTELESLEINDFSSPATPRIFPLLPPSLTSLVFSDSVSARFPDLAELPSHLMRFILPVHSLSNRNLITMPPHLTDIGLNVGYYALHTLFSKPNLLPNLISFPTNDGSALPEVCFEKVRHNHGGIWPHNIHSLNVLIMSKIETLPKNLISLTIENCAGFIDSLWLRTVLPRSVSKLSLSSKPITWDEVSVSDWPTNLTDLQLPRNDRRLDPSRYSALPRSLKKLNFTLSGPFHEELVFSDEDFENCLNLGRIALKNPEELRCWYKAKEWMLLIAKKADERYRAALDEYCSVIENGSLLGLPLSLTHLEGDFVLPSSIPPYLSRLTVEAPLQMCRNRFWSFIPPSLTALALKNCNATTVEQWSVLTSNPEESSLYSSSIRTLSLVRSNISSEVAQSLITCLPHSLTTLILEVPQLELKTECLRALPSTLDVLTLLLASISPSVGWASSLPRKLNKLTIQSNDAKLTGSDWENLPPLLEHLDVVVEATKIGDILAGPKKIRSLPSPRFPRESESPSDYMTFADFRALNTRFRPALLMFTHPREEIVKVIEEAREESSQW